MSMPQLIRFAWQSDRYQQSVELRDRVLRIPLGLKLSDQDILAEREQLHFGVIRERKLIGCVVAVCVDDRTAKLRQMAIDPVCQTRGYGSLLIRHVESELAQAGYQKIVLHARTPAIRFYTKHGYVQEGEEFTEVNIPHVKMCKSVTNNSVPNTR